MGLSGLAGWQGWADPIARNLGSSGSDSSSEDEFYPLVNIGPACDEGSSFSSFSSSSLAESSELESEESSSSPESSFSSSESLPESSESSFPEESSGSSKDTAIVPANFTAGGYTALYVREADEVLFDHRLRGVWIDNRLSKKWPLPRCMLVVEDTASSGNAITEAAQKAAKNWPNAKIIKAAIYASSRGAKACDLVGKLYERPHFLEWNFPNAWIYANMAYDFDGIFCEDCSKEADDDGPRYEEFLRNARPKYLPRKYPVKLIVTARLEKWRPQTEAWLRRHRIAFRELAMGPWPSLAARRAAHDVDKFKSYCLAYSSCYAFAESEPAQAESICRLVSRGA